MILALTSPLVLTSGLVILSLLIAAYLWTGGGELAAGRAGKLLFLAGALVFPLVALLAGASQDMRGAEQTKFCLSCHEMGPFYHSLYVDEDDAIPALHYQNRYVPRDAACYTCHRDYTMFGTLKDKLTGMHHVYVHFLGKIPDPDKIALYKPYPNSNCLQCHGGSRKFDASSDHNSKDAPLADIYSGKISCGTSGCHDSIHMIKDLKDENFWKPKPEEQP